MIIGIEAQEEVRVAYLAKFDGGPVAQGYLMGLSAVMHAVTNMLVADVLPQFAGKKGASSEGISMEYVAQLFIESVNMGMKMQDLEDDRYREAVALSLANLQEMFPLEPREDESE